MRATGFCCAGCSYVYRLVHEHGLAGYYRIKDDVTAPADAAVFQPRDYAWLEAAQREAEGGARSPGEPGLVDVKAGAQAGSPVRQPQEPEPGATERRPHLAPPELTLDIQGISCAGCVWLIERIFQQLPGARDVVVNPQYGTMRLRWVRGEFSAVEFARKLQTFGYLVGPAGEAVNEPESRGLVKRIGLCAAFAMNVMLFSLPTYFGMDSTFEWAGLFGLLNLAFGTLSFFVGGTYFLSRALRALRERALHIDLPIAIGIVGAYLGSLYGWFTGHERFVYFDFVSAFILLMLVGRWAQVAAVERNRRRLLSQQPKPSRVRLAAGGEIAPEKLAAGQILLLGSGQTLVVESQLDGPEAAFSLASINGEAEPRVFRAGQRVPAGAVNIGRADVRLVARQAWSESLLARLLQTGERPGERHALLERIVRGYVIGIIAVASLAGLGWWLGTGDGLRTWAVITAVLVVSCPCAVALAFPLADEMATVSLRRRGVFVREGELWPKLARVRQLIFDKTGTLTLENPVLRNPEALGPLDASARHALYSLVSDNPHPISQCLLENLLASGPLDAPGATGPPAETLNPGPPTETLNPGPPGGTFVPVPPGGTFDLRPPAGTPDPRPPAEVRETIGLGVALGPWSLGRPGWRSTPPATCHVISDNAPLPAPFVEENPPSAECHLLSDILPSLSASALASGAVEMSHSKDDNGVGGHDAGLVHAGRVVARFRFVDSARPDARIEVAALRARGLTIGILSGDRAEKVAALARELDIPTEQAKGGLSPQAKADWLVGHGAGHTLMLGDGANDSLAFDRALCRGTPVIHRGVLERKSDFYYLGRGIGGLRALFEIDAIRRRTQSAILVFSVGYNVFAVGLAGAGHMNPLVAAIFMPVSSLTTLLIVSVGMRPAFRNNS